MTEFRFSNSTCQIEGEIVPVAELALAQGDARRRAHVHGPPRPRPAPGREHSAPPRPPRPPTPPRTAAFPATGGAGPARPAARPWTSPTACRAQGGRSSPRSATWPACTSTGPPARSAAHTSRGRDEPARGGFRLLLPPRPAEIG